MRFSMNVMKGGQELMSLCMWRFSLISLLRFTLASTFVDDVSNTCLDNRSIGRFGVITNLQPHISSPDVSLAVLNGNSLVRVTQNNEIFRVTGEVNAREGYVDGPLKKARFRKITSYLQLNSSFILVVDSGNNCVRSIDMTRGIVDIFSGFCSVGSMYHTHHSKPGRKRISYTYPYHLTSDPSNKNVAYLTDLNYVRQIDIDTKYVTIVYDHSERGEEDFNSWKLGAPAEIPPLPQLHWVAFMSDLIYITTELHGVIILNQDWHLQRTISPKHLVGDESGKLSLNHIYPQSPKLLLITFLRDGDYFADPNTLVYDLVNPERSSVLENIPQLREEIGDNFSFIESISWMNRQLIYTGRPGRSRSQLGCVPMVSVSFTGTAVNNTDNDEEVSTTQVEGSLTNETNDKETVTVTLSRTLEKTTPYVSDSTVSSGLNGNSELIISSSPAVSSYDKTQVVPTQISTIKKHTQFPSSTSAQKGSTAYPKYPDNKAEASSISSSGDGNFVQSSNAGAGDAEVTLPFLPRYLNKWQHSNVQNITEKPNRNSRNPNSDYTTINPYAQPIVNMPSIGAQFGIFIGVSVVVIIIIVSSIGFACCKHYQQRQPSIKSDTHQRPNKEVLDSMRILPRIPDNQIGLDGIYEQINLEEHYYSRITESTVNNAATETGHTVVTPSQSTSTVGSPMSIYVLNATCDERDV